MELERTDMKKADPIKEVFITGYLSERRVCGIFNDCLVTDVHLISSSFLGADKNSSIKSGLHHSFDSEKLDKHKEEIQELILDLPDSLNKGATYSLLTFDKNGTQWTSNLDVINNLVSLSIALDLLEPVPLAKSPSVEVKYPKVRRTMKSNEIELKNLFAQADKDPNMVILQTMGQVKEQEMSDQVEKVEVKKAEPKKVAKKPTVSKTVKVAAKKVTKPAKTVAKKTAKVVKPVAKKAAAKVTVGKKPAKAVAKTVAKPVKKASKPVKAVKPVSKASKVSKTKPKAKK